MQIPFTAVQFFQVFRDYNTTVWPAQVLLLALAAAAVTLVFVPKRWASRGIAVILAFLWTWLGLVYHLAFFTAINPLAFAFAAMSVAGAGIFLWYGVVRMQLVFRWTADTRSTAGLVLVIFAFVLYPVWASASGHGYPELPTFGLPCPTTLFTLGLLALVEDPYPRAPLVVPVLWCLVGVQAAVLFGLQADLALVAAGILGLVLLARPQQRLAKRE